VVKSSEAKFLKHWTVFSSILYAVFVFNYLKLHSHPLFALYYYKNIMQTLVIKQALVLGCINTNTLNLSKLCLCLNCLQLHSNWKRIENQNIVIYNFYCNKKIHLLYNGKVYPFTTINKGNAKRGVSPCLKIWPGDLDLWPWKSIGFQILLRTKCVKSKSIERCWF
jgi:hypothetical protein